MEGATDPDPSPPDPFLWGVGIEGSTIPHLDVCQYRWTGHDDRWRDDLRIIRDRLGPCWLRYPLRWGRIQPRPDRWRWRETAERLEHARALGFRLMPGLVHFGTPSWLPGSFGDPLFPEAVERFAERFARRFGDLVDAYVPLNEPLVTALFCGDLGIWPPHGKGWRSYMAVASRIAQGLVRASAAIRGVNPDATIVYAEAVESHSTADPALDGEVTWRNQRRFLLLDLTSGRVDVNHPLWGWLLENGFSEHDLRWLADHPQPPGFLGLDYYAHSETQIWLDDGLVRHKPPDAPRGFAALAAEYHGRYGWPLLLTETNASGAAEVKAAWLNDVVGQIRLARSRGVPLHGLFWWPAFDHVDWDGALLHRSGNVHPVGLWALEPAAEGYVLAETPAAAAFAALAAAGDEAVAPLADPSSPVVEATAAAPPPRPDRIPIVVHSHLRWSFVWQRPQQTHSRLASRHPILFLEEPVWIQPGEPARIELDEAQPGVLVGRPMLPHAIRERQSAVDEATNALLAEAVQGPLAPYSRAVHWLYTPLMEPRLDPFPDLAAVVYDCMDELSGFAFAPAELAEREDRLLARADVVFTGGYELYRSRAERHGNVHFFGCGVDFAHFSRAANGAAPPPDLAFVPRPRLGYIGVIDERIDYGLVRDLGHDHPEWSLVLVGPVVKVDPGALPRPRNAYYLGARNYDVLPSYLAGFDVCLMPFALNDATRFINPTKTLEYLATGRPVVSTPIRDVVRGFGEAVRIAPREEFARAVAEVLADPGDGSARMEVARGVSWESIVERMEALVEEAVS